MKRLIYLIVFLSVISSCSTINIKYPKTINQTNKNGKYGLWIEKDSTTKNIIIAGYKNNMKNGSYIEYIDLTDCNNTMLKNMFSYKDEKLCFDIENYACQTGYVICVGKYKNNMRVGSWNYFLNNGYNFKTIKYKNGSIKYIILHSYI